LPSAVPLIVATSR
jgi:serine/threonine protein kinase